MTVICIASQVSYAAQPSQNIATSFSLFQELCTKSVEGILQYLNRNGCSVQDGDGVYFTQVRGGSISILPEDISFMRAGAGPLEFSTSDANVRDAWYRGLRKAGYEKRGSIWVKEPDTTKYPQFSIYDYLNDPEAKYYGSCILVMSSYPTKAVSSQSSAVTYQGTIGKYKITMRLDSPAFTGDVWTVTGVYWYGTGKNGKMTLSGTYSERYNIYELGEYDPNGNPCGSFKLIRDGNTLSGSMTNKAGTKFNVHLTQE